MKESRREITFSNNLLAIDWNELANVFEKAPLGLREPGKLERTFKGSYLCCFVHADSLLIGAGRAISDGESNSSIFDVVLLPEYQSQGIGTQIIKYLLDRLPQRTVHLVAVPGKEEFYRKLGFRRLRTAFALYSHPEALVELGYIE